MAATASNRRPQEEVGTVLTPGAIIRRTTPARSSGTPSIRAGRPSASSRYARAARQGSRTAASPPASGT